ncbi:UvrD-helicase domain-containing protein [Kutzneria sp. 744]|uniref:UvrD-helicase domain-containing protein n=1 Tax=Kutzneria sp. (strain 744) TaxID=345341 RepID=UPI0003EEB982|nr:UvrD-helicase domain-containing protein [Kutzneria sp. 744]EWM09771.1 ATP-dependent DNA helicase PcrA [Kutzneria sp. 744]
MRFYADLHIHSKYSRACSRDCDLEHLTWWAQRKGISLVGTGDFTHPAWYDHLRETLVPAEPGLFRLRPELDRDIARTLPPSCVGDVRFMLSVEISTIYKRDDRTRKVHHLIYMPSFDAAAEFNRRLGKIGNLGSDGRPILGLDSRDLLEITLESGEGSYLVPAHVWTPWFAVLGSKSGFDAIADCYADLADHVFAAETGLSSDPEMNWRVSGLDRYTLVSNSDAHSPPVLGREATVFDTDMDYFAVRRALETREGFGGTVEFFPEEGKYHSDGHRKCDVRFGPAETIAHNGLCPACGKPLTVGVLSRIQELADRELGYRPADAVDFRSLIPLPEIMSELLGVGPKSKKVLSEIAALTAAHGPELGILDDVPLDDLAASNTLLGEAIGRLRRGEVIRDAGYDGEYGVIRLFEPGELAKAAGSVSLFDDDLFAPPPKPKPVAAPVVADAPVEPELFEEPALPEPVATTLLDGLDPDQRAAAAVASGPLLIIAGPGTGKTRTLTHRIAHLVTERGVPASQCLAITFTRRAAAELAERLEGLVGPQAHDLTVATFHSLGVRILREQHARVGLTPRFGIADEAVVQELRDEHGEMYKKELRARDLVDFDDLVEMPVELLAGDTSLIEHYRARWPWVSVDEYQDVDETQYRLLRLLCAADGNLTAIGDPDQAIYRFRGADVGFFLRFQEDFPDATRVQLGRNYRSGKHILAGAVQAITPTTLVENRSLEPCGAHTEHALIGLHHAIDEQAEASFVARTIDQLLGGSSFHSLDTGRVAGDGTQGLSFNDFAVLYRTSAQARAVMEALTRAGVPFQKRSHDRLTDRPGVRALARELGLVGLHGSVVERVRQAAHGLDDEDSFTALELLMPLALRHGDDLSGFLSELALGAEVDTWDPRADRVSLLTLHASKGLEFPVVFLVGCEDGLLPMRWPGETLDQEAVDEERRLFFVGMTRAQQHLYLSHASSRLRQGAVRSATPSPFLSAISPTVTDRIGDPVPRKRKPKQETLF